MEGELEVKVQIRRAYGVACAVLHPDPQRACEPGLELLAGVQHQDRVRDERLCRGHKWGRGGHPVGGVGKDRDLVVPSSVHGHGLGVNVPADVGSLRGSRVTSAHLAPLEGGEDLLGLS